MNAAPLIVLQENFGRWLRSCFRDPFPKYTSMRELYRIWLSRRRTRRGRLIEKRERDEPWREWLDVGGEA